MILSILRHTPIWVFALFAGLLWLGILRTRANDIAVSRLAVLPLAMTGFSLFGLVQACGFGIVPTAAWALAFALALMVGWMLPLREGVQYSPASRTVRVPGSWLPLALMMIIFFTRYAVAVSLAMHPALRSEAIFVDGIAALYGLSSGCFAARALLTWRSAFRAHGGRTVAVATVA